MLNCYLSLMAVPSLVAQHVHTHRVSLFLQQNRSVSLCAHPVAVFSAAMLFVHRQLWMICSTKYTAKRGYHQPSNNSYMGEDYWLNTQILKPFLTMQIYY